MTLQFCDIIDTFVDFQTPSSKKEESKKMFTSCRNLYSFCCLFIVNGSGSITSVGEERANLSAVVYL